MNEAIAEVIAHLDTFERDLESMRSKVREYRHMLFAANAAAGLDTQDSGLLD